MRRRCPSLLLILALACPAAAQEPPQTENPPSQPARLTWEQRFAHANLAGDGHLTLPEAKAGLKLIARHFNEIDIEHKGYVTANDIRAWQILRKAERRLQPVPQKPKPLHAFQLRLLGLSGDCAPGQVLSG